jgi:CHAT domain-containing protein
VQREVEALPWEWIYVGGEHLSRRNPAIRMSQWLSAAVVGQPPRLLLIGDPQSPETGKLPGALEEVQRIAALAEGTAEVELLTGEDATVANVVSALRRGDVDVFHFAGHAWFDGSEHYLALADGVVRASEFRSVISARPPGLVVLNSHYTAFVPPFVKVREQGRGQEEVSAPEQLRFMDVVMAAGCGAFVGCLGSPMDHTARDVALGLYERLFAGESVARGLHRSLVGLASEPRSDALLYAMSGSADLVLVTAPEAPTD